MSTTDYVSLDQIADFGDLVPAGQEFRVKATKIGAEETKQKDDGTGGGKPFLQLTFSILDGDYEGIDVTKSYFLSITKSKKNGKLYAKGIMALKADMAAIGHPISNEFRFAMTPSKADVQAVAVEVAKRVKPAITPFMRMRSIATRQQTKDPATEKWGDAYNDDGTPKMRTEYVIVGGPKAGDQLVAQAATKAAPPPPPTDPLDFL